MVSHINQINPFSTTPKTQAFGLSRRSFMKVGIGFAGSVALSAFPDRILASSTEGLNLSANWRVVPIPRVRQKPIFLIWLEGGLSHFDTFSPIPTAPDKIRGPYSQIQTSVPGVHLSEKLPLTARHMNKIALMRNIKHNDHNHSSATSLMLTGSSLTGSGNSNSKYDSFAVRLGKYLGQTQIGYVTFNADPGNPFLYPGVGQNESLHVKQQGTVNNEGATPYPSPFGEGFDRQRHRGRTNLLSQINSTSQIGRSPATQRWNDLVDRANSMLDGDLNGAFDLTRVPDKIRDRYGKTSFGNAALIGKRLIDAGAPIITVNKVGWDNHSNIKDALDKNLPELDRILDALFVDIGDRVIIAVGTEFGRTPMNSSNGRDHWAHSSFLLIGGAGINPRVYGELDNGGQVAGEDGIFPGELAGPTIARAAGYEFVEERAGVLTSTKMPYLPIFG